MITEYLHLSALINVFVRPAGSVHIMSYETMDWLSLVRTAVIRRTYRSVAYPTTRALFYNYDLIMIRSKVIKLLEIQRPHYSVTSLVLSDITVIPEALPFFI